MNKKDSIIGIFPGTFDPITFGHLDIIKRASLFCSELIIGIVSSKNSKKKILFSDEERLEMIDNETRKLGLKSRVFAKIFDGLLVDFAKEQTARIIIRGLRPYHDFGFEFRMACVNKKLDENLETIFLTSLEENQFISSTLVKEVGMLGGDVEKFLPNSIAHLLKQKIDKIEF